MLVNVIQPGAGAAASALRRSRRVPAAAPAAGAVAGPSGVELIVAMVPDNPFKAAANGDMIGVIVFALIFGVASGGDPHRTGRRACAR